MNTITVSHRGRLVALAAPRRFWLAADIEALPDGHPRKRFVAFMVLYARDVLTGQLPGPYNDADAERFARLALMERQVDVHPCMADASTPAVRRSGECHRRRRRPPPHGSP
jgi:hypothetical protein